MFSGMTNKNVKITKSFRKLEQSIRIFQFNHNKSVHFLQSILILNIRRN